MTETADRKPETGNGKRAQGTEENGNGRTETGNGILGFSDYRFLRLTSVCLKICLIV